MEFKANIKYGKCGHTAENVVIKAKDEEGFIKRVNWLEWKGLCPECFFAEQHQKMLEDHHVERMKYGAFLKLKENGYKSVYGSYDAEDKTVEVYVPNKTE